MMKNAFFNRYGFRILIVIFFLLPLIGQGTNWTIKSNANNVADWLPKSFKETQQYQWFLENFPLERFVVVSWEGCTMDDSRLEMFAQKLVPGVTIDNFGRKENETTLQAELNIEENDPAQESERTEILPTPPSKYANFRSTEQMTDSISLIWDAVDGAAKYEVQYRTGNETWRNVTVSKKPIASKDPITISRLAADTTYEFQFRTVFPAGTFGCSSAKTNKSDWSPTPALSVKTKPYFETALTGPRLFRILRDTYSGDGFGAIQLSGETISEKLQGILIGPDGQSTALIVTLTKEAPKGKELALVLEAIKEIGRECGVHPQIQVDDRFFLAKMFGTLIKTIGEMVYGRNPDMTGVILGGPPVDNVAITQEGEQTLTRLIGLCGLIGLILAWICFRDFRLTMFVFWLAIISAGVALASVSFSGVLIKLVNPDSTFGTCDAILLSMPALVYVLAMSGAIHLINYYHDAVREHGLDMAPERAVQHAWYPCFFANMTTAFGLISLCMSGLIPISKFGFYSALGLMLQLLLLFYYLPTLLHFYPSHRIAAQRTLNIAENSTMQKIWRIWGGFMIRNSVPVSVVCVIVMIIFGFGIFQIKTSVKMMRFFSEDSEIIYHYKWLEEHLGPLVPMEVVVKFDNKHCKVSTLNRLPLIKETSDALRSELGDTIGGVMSAETFMPPPLRRATLVEKSTFSAFLDRKGRRAKGVRDYIAVEGNFSFRPGTDRLKNLGQISLSVEDADRLIRVGIDDVKKLTYTPADAELTGISNEELKTFREKAIQWERDHGIDLWRISLRVWSLKKDIDYAHFIQDVKDVVEPVILVENAINAEVNLFSFLPGDDRAQHLAQVGISEEDADRLTEAGIDDVRKLVVLSVNTKPEGISHEELGKFREKAMRWVKGQVKDSEFITVVYTGMVPVVYKTQHELHWGLQKSFMASFILIGIAISFVLRSPIAGFLAMIPNLFPVFLVFGFMGHYGTLVDIGTMMTASVALGIATDDTIHFLTWFRHGIDQGMSRADATRYAYSRSATAMLQTSVIAGLGLAAFALSTFTPTQMFGIMMLTILMVAMLGDLVFLAALLNTPIGRFFEPKKNRKT
jgi:predicted RND superfamily exporter protein